MKLIIKPGGELYRVDWVYDEEKDEGGYVETKLDNHLHVTYLFYPTCELDGVTLRDIFLLLDKNVTFYRVVFGNWLDEYIEEGLSQGEECEEVEYLELYRIVEKWDDGTESYIAFTGVGNDMNYGVSASPANEYADKPLRFGRTYICDKSNEEEWQKWPPAPFTLGEILHSIIWELSFYGPPKKRDKTWARI